LAFGRQNDLEVGMRGLLSKFGPFEANQIIHSKFGNFFPKVIEDPIGLTFFQ
jgi:hypothetical protein